MRPNLRIRTIGLVVGFLFALAAGSGAAAAQRGRGMMGDPGHQADMQLFHQLFDHRQEITRRVTMRVDGVETVTESVNPAVREALQKHVLSMLARVETARPIHQRDPLFREIFRNAAKIEVSHDFTANGIRVVETSADPYVVKLIQAHAEVVSAFIANGRSEMMKDHPLPPRTAP